MHDCAPLIRVFGFGRKVERNVFLDVSEKLESGTLKNVIREEKVESLNFVKFMPSFCLPIMIFCTVDF